MLEIKKNNSADVQERFFILLEDWDVDNAIDRFNNVDSFYEAWEGSDHFYIADDGELTCWEAGGDFFIPDRPAEIAEVLDNVKRNS